MKVILLIAALVVFSLAWPQFAKNFSDNSATTSPKQFQVARPRPIEMKDSEYAQRYPYIAKRVARESEKLGLVTLAGVNQPTNEEIRLWAGFGLTVPRCFILKKVQGEPAAAFAGPQVIGQTAVIDQNGAVASFTEDLAAPKSGWDSFTTFLKHQGIGYPIQPRPEGFQSDPDIEYFVVEVSSPTGYDMVYFTDEDEGEAATRVRNVCKTIEKEFGVQMDCLEAPPAQTDPVKYAASKHATNNF